jgi:hypothetical protein
LAHLLAAVIHAAHPAPLIVPCVLDTSDALTERPNAPL